MSAIETVTRLSGDLRTHLLAIEGEEWLHPRITRFFQSYFSEENPRNRGNFHLQNRGEDYFVTLRPMEANSQGDRFYSVKILSYETAHECLFDVPPKKEFIKDLKKMRKIPRESPLRPLDPPLQGKQYYQIRWIYSQEFLLQKSGEKTGKHHVSYGDHSISDQIEDALLIKAAKRLNRMKNKPKGVQTWHYQSEGRVLAFVFAVSEEELKLNNAYIIMSIFYPTGASLKQNMTELRYNAWLEGLPKLS